MNIADKLESPDSKDTLTNPEAQRLKALEKIVEIGLKTFVQVGEALLEIRESRLYRKQYKSFEEYCQKRWNFTSRQANRLIGAGVVVDTLKRDQLVSSEPLAVTPADWAVCYGGIHPIYESVKSSDTILCMTAI